MAIILYMRCVLCNPANISLDAQNTEETASLLFHGKE